MTTRDDLVNLVESYAKRTDLTARIVSEFLPLAESRIGRDLKSQENETTQEFLAQGSNPFAVPTDYGQARALKVSQTRGPITLKATDLHGINDFDQTGQPAVYLIANKLIEVRPFQLSDFTLFYWTRPTLPTAGSENDVLDRWPQVYLYAVLLELHRWERDQVRAAEALQIFDVELGRTNRDAGRAAGDKPQMRST